jgi:hypothetical protein
VTEITGTCTGTEKLNRGTEEERSSVSSFHRVKPFALSPLLALTALMACGRSPADVRSEAQPAPRVTAPAASVPHGDHNPHHGGVVMMKGDLHYEVVLDPSGRAHHVYFTDAVRDDLPASIATSVVLTIRRPSRPEEPLALQIDEAGESWIGSGQPVGSPETTTARLAFSIKGEPYWIDLPFAATAPAPSR